MVRAALSGVVALATSACFPSFEARSCWTSAQCAPSQLCRSGACVAGPADGGLEPDASLDAGPLDTGRPDSGLVDTGEVDGGLPDTGLADSGLTDGGCWALELNGTTDFLVAPYSPSMSLTRGVLVVEAWLYLETVPAGAAMIAARVDEQGARHIFELYTTSLSTYFNVYDSATPHRYFGYIDFAPLPTGRWFHLLAVYQRYTTTSGTFDYAMLFRDGRESPGTQASNTDFGPIDSSSTVELDVGRVPNAGVPPNDRPLAARIAALRISDQVPPGYGDWDPPPPQISFNPEHSLTATAGTTLVWPLDEGSGTMAIDGSGNGNHGLISGARWIPGGPPCE